MQFLIKIDQMAAILELAKSTWAAHVFESGKQPNLPRGPRLIE